MNATASDSTPHYRKDGEACDARTFYAVACDPTRPVVVEACAGAGKTWLLVSRIARALLLDTPPHEILAITFTKKASAEMAQRLQALLGSWRDLSDEALTAELMARGLSDQDSQQASLREKARGLHAVALSGRGVQIRTFHGWFAALLRMAPMSLLQSLALPSPYELLEDDTEAIAGVWPLFYAMVRDDPQLKADFQAALEVYGRHNLREALTFSLTKRIEFELADQPGNSSVAGLESAVADYRAVYPGFANCDDLQQPFDTVSAFKASLRAAAVALGTKKGNDASARAATRLGNAIDTLDMMAIVDVLLTQKGTPRAKGLSVDDPTVVETAQGWVIDWQGAVHQAACRIHQQRMVRLSRALLACFKDLKRQRGWVDMNDIESAATQLLADSALSAWVQQRLDAQISHLLIDEFQDTNPMQWRALNAWLEGYAGAGGGGNNPPSVFIVGDPKQSIYRFRRAEPRVFKVATAFLKEAMGASVLACDHTRRNAQSIISVVNAVMVPNVTNDPEAPQFRTHSTQRPEAGAVLGLPMVLDTRPPKTAPDAADHAAPGIWRDSLNTPKLEPIERLAALETQQAARWIRAQVDDGEVVPSEVMVIARTNARLSLMQEALTNEGVPCAQPDKSSLIESPAVADVIALLDALVSPTHDLSLAQALRSPLFNASDADLIELAQHIKTTKDKAPGAWWRAVEALAQTGASQLASRCQSWRDTLHRLKHRLAHESLHEALVGVYKVCDAIAAFSAVVPEAQRAATRAQLNALLDETLMINQGRYLTPYQFIRAIKAGTKQKAWPTPPGVVRLLTVHGAKGLESQLVVLLDTHAPPKPAQSMTVLVDWPAHDLAPRRFVFIAKESAPPKCAEGLLLRDQQARATEENNALYVAMTRAADRLVLSAHQPRSKDHVSWYTRLSTVMTPVDTHTEVDADTVMTKPSKATATNVDNALTVADIPAWSGRAAMPMQAETAGGDDLASRRGQAMHLLLSWCFAKSAGTPWSPSRLQSTRIAFGLTEADLHITIDQARAMLEGEGGWLWSAEQVAFEANEVAVFDAGELLRIDRLVQTVDHQWWVIDFKSSTRPNDDAVLRAQLKRYADVIARLTGSTAVNPVFMTPEGRLVPLNLTEN